MARPRVTVPTAAEIEAAEAILERVRLGKVQVLQDRALEIHGLLGDFLAEGAHWKDEALQKTRPGTYGEDGTLYWESIVDVQHLSDIEPGCTSGELKPRRLRSTPADPEIALAIRDLMAIARAQLGLKQIGETDLERYLAEHPNKKSLTEEALHARLTNSYLARAFNPPEAYGELKQDWCTLDLSPRTVVAEVGRDHKTAGYTSLPPQVPSLHFVSPTAFTSGFHSGTMSERIPRGATNLRNSGRGTAYDCIKKSSIDGFALVGA